MALVWCRSSLRARKEWKSRTQWLLPFRCVRQALPSVLVRWVGVWLGLVGGPFWAFSSVSEVLPRVIFARGVSHVARLGCCRRQHGRSSVTLLRAASGSGVGCPLSSWTVAAVAVSEGSVVWLLHPGVVDRRGPTGAGQTARVGSVADRMAAGRQGVVRVGSASGCCVLPASGAHGPSETVGAGALWLCLGWVALGEVGFGSCRCCVGSGHLGCGGPLCGASANAVGLGHPGYRPSCVP